MFACAPKMIMVVLITLFFPIPSFSCSYPYIRVIGFECHPNTPIFPVIAYLPFYQLKGSGTSSQFFPFFSIGCLGSWDMIFLSPCILDMAHKGM